MHTLIHRALSPQTISYAWLVLTVALTFALAVAQSAVAAGPSLSAAGFPAPHVALTGTAPAPVPAREAARCRAAAPAEDQRAGAHVWSPGRHAACRALGASAGPAVAGAGILAPFAPHRGADALAAIYGGAGPHGPPAPAGIQTNSPVPPRLFGTDLDLDFSLSPARSAVSGPSAPAVEASSSLTPVIGTPA
jgi:hypothetical protein